MAPLKETKVSWVAKRIKYTPSCMHLLIICKSPHSDSLISSAFFFPVQIFKGNKDIPEQEIIAIRNLTSCQSTRISLAQYRTRYIYLIRQGIVKQKRNKSKRRLLSFTHSNKSPGRQNSLPRNFEIGTRYFSGRCIQLIMLILFF